MLITFQNHRVIYQITKQIKEELAQNGCNYYLIFNFLLLKNKIFIIILIKKKKILNICLLIKCNKIIKIKIVKKKLKNQELRIT